MAEIQYVSPTTNSGFIDDARLTMPLATVGTVHDSSMDADPTEVPWSNPMK